MNDSISVIIPAYNEEHSVKDAVKVANSVVSHQVNDYEIIIINDGSTDKTGDIANYLTKKNPHIKVIHHKTNLGFGVAFDDGVRVASKMFITGFPADNDMYKKTFRDIVSARTNGSLILSYMSDMSERQITRKIISVLYTAVMNFIFRLHLKYYNGYFICSLKHVKTLTVISKGFTYFAEIKIKLIKKGMPYKEIPYVCAPRAWGRSKAFTGKNVMHMLWSILKLYREIQ